MPIRLFLSHSARDKDLAETLVHLFQYALKLKDQEIRCTSVVPYTLDAGANTDATLQSELRESDLVIGLLSRESSDSYYVLAELGARWGISKQFMLLRSSNFSFTHFSGPMANLSISTIDTKTVLYKHCRQAAAIFGKKVNKTKELEKRAKRVIRHNKKLSITPFEILSAQWGSGTTYREVSARLRQLIWDYRIKTFVGVELAGFDPTPGVAKSLKISYTVLGEKRTTEAHEGTILELP